jgi:hypothetical protein
MQRWRLYVDESGECQRAGAAGGLAMAGVLVPIAACSPEALDRARTNVERDYPWLGWPLHRVSFTRTLAHLMALDRTDWAAGQRFPHAPPPAELRPQVASMMADPAAAAEQAKPEPSLQFIQYAIGRIPDQRWRSWFRHEDDAWFERAADVVRKFLKLEPSARVFLVGEGQPGKTADQRESAYPWVKEEPELVPYLALLEVLLRRVGDALLEQAGDHEVELWISAIDVNDKPLRPEDVLRLWDEAFQTRKAHRGLNTVTAVVAEVKRYRSTHTHAWFVAADFASSLARTNIFGHVDLKTAAANVASKAGFPVDAEVLAAAGRVHRALQRARPCDGAPEKDLTVKAKHCLPWAYEQTARWLRVPLR